MSDPQTTTSRWQALPGWLAALAAFIAVIGGLVALLFQFGILGRKDDEVRSAAPRPAAPLAAAPGPPAPAPAPSAFPMPIPPIGKRSWAQTEAVIRTQDGMENRLRADSIGHCMPTTHGFSLDDGKSIPFERMAGFEVYHSDPPASPDAKARLLVEMVDGQKVQATVAAACELSGDSMEGHFSAHLEGVRSIRFER